MPGMCASIRWKGERFPEVASDSKTRLTSAAAASSETGLMRLFVKCAPPPEQEKRGVQDGEQRGCDQPGPDHGPRPRSKEGKQTSGRRLGAQKHVGCARGRIDGADKQRVGD